MKYLLIMLGCVVSIEVAAATKLTPAVRRVIGREITELIRLAGAIPLQPGPRVDVQLLIDDYLRVTAEALVADDDVINHYEQSLEIDSSDRDHGKLLVERISAVAYTVAKDYAKQQRNVEFMPRDVQQKTTKLLQIGSLFNHNLEREGSVSISQLYTNLIDIYRAAGDRESLQIVTDTLEYLRHYNSSTRLTEKEYNHLLDYARDQQTTYAEVEAEKNRIILSPDYELINKYNCLHITDLVTENTYNEYFDKYKKVLYGSRDIGMLMTTELSISGGNKFFPRFTAEQLLNKRFFAGVTAQLLIAMGWNWSEFAELLNARQYSLHEYSYHIGTRDDELLNKLQMVLQAELEKLTDSDARGIIQDFLAELPELVAKERFMKTAFFENKKQRIYEDEQRQQTLEQAISDYLSDRKKIDMATKSIEILEQIKTTANKGALVMTAQDKKRVERNQRRAKRKAEEQKQREKQQEIRDEQEAEQQKIREEQQAEQQKIRDAEQQIANEIDKLRKKIGKESLPATTPAWMHLRAIIIYAGTSVQNLAERAALRNTRKRFFALTADNASTTPNKSDLDSISEALRAFINKRYRPDPRQKSRLNTGVIAEIEALRQRIDE